MELAELVVVHPFDSRYEGANQTEAFRAASYSVFADGVLVVHSAHGEDIRFEVGDWADVRFGRSSDAQATLRNRRLRLD